MESGHGLVLPAFAVAIARHVAGAHVDESGAPQPSGEGQGVPRSAHVAAQRRVERRVEDDVAGRVHDDVAVGGEARGHVLRQPQKGLAYVALHDRELVLEVALQPCAVPPPQGIERRGWQDLLAEAASGISRRADEEVEMTHLREAVEEEGSEHLAQEARAPAQEDAALREGFSGGKPGLAHATSAITMGGRWSMVTSAERPTWLRPIAIASSSEAARSQPRRS